MARTPPKTPGTAGAAEEPSDVIEGVLLSAVVASLCEAFKADRWKAATAKARVASGFVPMVKARKAGVAAVVLSLARRGMANRSVDLSAM